MRIPIRRLTRKVAGATAVLSVAAALSLATAPAAQAAFPGLNGKVFYTAYVGSNQQIFSMNADGTGVTQLTFADNNGDAVANADGTKLAFLTNRSGSYQVWVMDSDGTDPVQVGTAGYYSGLVSAGLSWSPDGRVYYTSNADQITYVNADGTGQTNTGLKGEDPTVSPDGSKIVYTIGTDDFVPETDVWTANADGTNPVKIIDNGPQKSTIHTDWSPDGTRIAVTYLEQDQGSSVLTVKPDGTSPVTVAPYTADTWYALPQWSPDGTRILYTDFQSTTLYSAAPDGTATTTIPVTANLYSVTDWAAGSAPAQADTALTLTAASTHLLSGSITYTAKVTNNGPAATTGTTVVVNVPATTAYISGLPSGCTYNAPAKKVTCAIGAQANGTTATRSFHAVQGVLTIGIPLNATAAITASTPADPQPANNTATAGCTIVTGLLILC
ncbi:Tol-Pal system protein TolB [Streptomyces avidinii]